jgi:hypothetical protein
MSDKISDLEFDVGYLHTFWGFPGALDKRALKHVPVRGLKKSFFRPHYVSQSVTHKIK